MALDAAQEPKATQSPEAAILDLVGQAAPGKSVSPEDVARLLDPERWRRRLGQVRGASVGLARAGLIVILRHGKPADPNTFKGVYRLRAPGPAPAEPVEGSTPI